MDQTSFTISDCYTGSIERLFNPEFLQFALYVHEKFGPSFEGILEAKSVRSDFRPTWTSIIMNYEHIIHENLEVIAIRGSSSLEYNLCFDGKPICAGILDLIVPLYFMKNKHHSYAIYFSDCDLEIEKTFWQNVVSHVTQILDIKSSQIKMHFLIENKITKEKNKQITTLPLPNISSHSDLTNYWDRVI